MEKTVTVLSLVLVAICLAGLHRAEVSRTSSLAEVETLSGALAGQARRIADLEARLAGEIAARERLAEAATFHATRPDAPDRPATAAAPIRPQPREPRGPRAPRTASASTSASVALSPLEAEVIERQVRRVEADRLAQAWRHRRQAWLEHPDGFAMETLNPLRAGLGDEVYERYLESHGRATAVSVSGIVAASPAAEAGLQPGDEITHYDGRRVFHLHELHALSVQGDPGEYVNVQVRRGEQVIYLTLSRGPLGVAAHRRTG